MEQKNQEKSKEEEIRIIELDKVKKCMRKTEIIRKHNGYYF